MAFFSRSPEGKLQETYEVREGEDVQEAEASKKKVLKIYIFLFMWLMFLVLPSVSIVIFHAFPCIDIDPDGVLRAAGQPTRFLRADLSISCSSYRYYLGTSWAAAMIVVYPVGVLASYFYVLFVNRKAIKYRDDPSILSSLDQQRLLKRRIISHEEIKFLYNAYRPRYWYWEIIETVRRLLLTGVLSIVNVGTTYQIVVGILIAIAFVYVNDQYKPSPNRADNILQEMSQYLILLTLIGALLIRTQAFNSSTSDGEGSIGIGLVILFSAFMALVLHFCLFELVPSYSRLIVRLQESLKTKKEATTNIPSFERDELVQRLKRQVEEERRDKEKMRQEKEREVDDLAVRNNELETEILGLRRRFSASENETRPKSRVMIAQL